MSKPEETRRNTIAGWITLGLLGGIVAVVIAVFSVGATLPDPRAYVLYVTDAGTLRNGDPVYMSGRRIGRVTDTQVVSHEGEVQTRVAIELFERFRDLDLPGNTRASVGGPGLVAGPRLFIHYGSSEDVIEQGGEITDTQPAPRKDQFTSIGDQVRVASAQIDIIVEILSDEDRIAQIKLTVAEFQDGMRETAARLDEWRPYAADLVDMMRSRPEQLKDILADVRYGIGDISAELDDLTASLDAGAERVDDVRDNTRDAIARLEDYERLSASAADGVTDPEMKTVLLRARWQSAEMAAMLRLALQNPAAAGDTPRKQRVNEAFNGGETTLGPLGGDTDVDEIK